MVWGGLRLVLGAFFGVFWDPVGFNRYPGLRFDSTFEEIQAAERLRIRVAHMIRSAPCALSFLPTPSPGYGLSNFFSACAGKLPAACPPRDGGLGPPSDGAVFKP